MRRLNSDEIILSNEELEDIYTYIRSSLYWRWDDHTNRFITKDSDEVGMRRMDPEMYDMAQLMLNCIQSSEEG